MRFVKVEVASRSFSHRVLIQEGATKVTNTMSRFQREITYETVVTAANSNSLFPEMEGNNFVLKQLRAMPYRQPPRQKPPFSLA